MASWINVLRMPDFVTGATEGSPLRFEENRHFFEEWWLVIWRTVSYNDQKCNINR